MTAISQSAGYAVLALGCVTTARGKPKLVRTIAEECGLPAPYLSKVINRLARAGIVHTQRGVNGGVSIARRPEELTLYDVCEALDDPILERRCMLGVNGCDEQHPCPAHEVACTCREMIMSYLKRTTIEDVAAHTVFPVLGPPAAEPNGIVHVNTENVAGSIQSQS